MIKLNPKTKTQNSNLKENPKFKTQKKPGLIVLDIGIYLVVL
jgi:hypothetical protein